MTRSSAGREDDADAAGAGAPAPTTVDHLDPELRRFRDLSHLLDDSIRLPGTRVRIGIEPLVGLLPVVGDVLGVTVAGYALAVAARAGVPRATLGRIALVYWIDAVGGAVPVLGDLFDLYWKANLRTVGLLDARLADPASAAADRRFLRRAGLVALGLGLVVVGVLVGLGWWLAAAI